MAYEVVWVRLAMASFGVTTALVSIVLSIFMAGLGLGSWGVGALTRGVLKLNGPRALRLYCVAELLIGSSALLVPRELGLGRQLLLHISVFGAWQSSRYYIFVIIWIVITLFPWCTCLGSTFPLLMAVMRQSPSAASGRSFSYLYVANVIGALLGTLLSAFILIELLGFQGTLYIAAGLNALIALLAFCLSFRVGYMEFAPGSLGSAPAGQNLYGLPKRTALILLFTTGFVTMGTEVVWIRQFTPYLGNFVYAFALILAAYLFSTFIGARDYRNWARSHHSDESATTWNLLAVSVLIPVLGATPLNGFGPNGVRLVSIVFFCVLTGFLTPLLVDSWSAGEPDRAGTAYAFNVLGCIAGPLVASFWLEPWLGDRWSLFALSLPLFGIAAIIALHQSSEPDRLFTPRRLRTKFAIAILAAVPIFALAKITRPSSQLAKSVEITRRQ